MSRGWELKSGAGAPLARRRLLGAGAAGGAVVAGAALGACIPGGGSGPGGQGASRPGVKPGTTLQWMYWSSPGPWLEANQKEAAAFEAQHAKDGLKIEQLNVASGPTFLDKLSSLVAGGTPPDVAEIMPWDVPQFQTRKTLLNLTPYLKRDKYDLADFFQAGFDQYRWTADGRPAGTTGGDLWGVPRDFPTRALGYNVDALQAAGAKLPAGGWEDGAWSPQAFLDTALRVTRRGEGPNGVSLWGWNGHEGLQEWMPWVFNVGGEFVSPDGRESRWDNPKTVEALQFLADLQHRHKVAPTPQQRQTEGAMDQAFFNGRLAMMHFGPAQLGRYRQAVQGFTWDVAVWPRSAGSGTAVGSGSGWLALAGGRDPEGSWLLLQHLLSPETQQTDSEAGSGVPVRRSTMEQVFVKQPAPPRNVKVFMDNARVARIVPQVPRWTEMMEVVNRELPALWRGEKTAREVCAEIERQVEPILKAGGA
ncbi:MAG TPA: sugar ABC transporter substrate-binding protein [Chloroflexota bacterium]|nr:sugar ABC transporter substrate-binding protein [Chloroflexota bacterium]